MRSIYGFLEEEPYEHDFEHVEFDADEFDIRLGTPGLHRVGRRVEWKERESVLPPDLIARYVKSAFWMDCQSDVRVI
jgi:sulfotransferase